MPVDSGRRLQSPATDRVRPGLSSYGPGLSTSPAYRQALVSLEKFGRDRTATVLIEGESGTGKTLLARRLHELSPRRHAPYRASVLSALDDNLAADELFGHVAGAFTGARENRNGLFASAAGGTVFLDEIGKASLAVQQKLLHVIEYGELLPLGADRVVTVDVRVVAASNIPLAHLVRDGTFLPDLYARLKCFRIVVPPLRARPRDIPQLVHECLYRHGRECGYASVPTVDDALMAALARAPWPDNLRELDGTIHRLLVEADGAGVLTTDLCVGDLAHFCTGQSPDKPLDIETVRRAMAETNNKKARAARVLGVSRSTVHRVLRDAEEARAVDGI